MRTQGRQNLRPQVHVIVPLGPIRQIQVEAAWALGPLPNIEKPDTGPETFSASIAAKWVNPHHHLRHFARVRAARTANRP